MARWVLILLILLLAGAVVNVTVAWGCTTYSWTTAGPRRELPGPAASRLLEQHAPPDWPVLPISEAWRKAGSGISETMVACWEDRLGGSLYVIDGGWPARSLRYVLAVTNIPGTTDNDMLMAWEVPGGVVGSLGPVHLPLHPIWPGFAVNTLFYAAILGLLAFGLFALRRQLRLRRVRRRGLCPACAYPMGESTVCTECGKALRGRTETPT